MNLARWIVLTISLFFAVLIQPIFLARLNLPGATIDLVLVLVCAWGILKGPLVGATAGFIAGILLDLVPPAEAVLGLNSLAFTTVGFIVGVIGVKPSKSFFRPLLTIAIASMLLILIRAVLISVFVSSIAFSRVWELLITQAIYTSLLAVFVIPLITWLDRKLGPSSRIDELRI